MKHVLSQGSVGFFHHSVPVQSPWCLLGFGVAQEVEVECDRLAEMSIQLSMQLFTEERLGVDGGGLNEMFQVLIVFILDFITHLTETIKVMVLNVCENEHLGDSRPFFGWVSPLACFFWREWCLHSRW